MKKITADLENCYGIKKLKQVFDFTHDRAYAIYAPSDRTRLDPHL